MRPRCSPPWRLHSRCVVGWCCLERRRARGVCGRGDSGWVTSPTGGRPRQPFFLGSPALALASSPAVACTISRARLRLRARFLQPCVCVHVCTAVKVFAPIDLGRLPPVRTFYPLSPHPQLNCPTSFGAGSTTHTPWAFSIFAGSGTSSSLGATPYAFHHACNYFFMKTAVSNSDAVLLMKPGLDGANNRCVGVEGVGGSVTSG